MPDAADQQPQNNDDPVAPPVQRRGDGKFAPGNTIGYGPGQTGNPRGRRPGASFAAALARQARAPVRDREEMAKIARTIGLDPDEVSNIDVIASLLFVVLARQLVRATERTGRTDDRVVGLLQLLHRALDPQELRLSGPDGGPINIAAVVANVQIALGMRPGTDVASLSAGASQLVANAPLLMAAIDAEDGEGDEGEQNAIDDGGDGEARPIDLDELDGAA